VKQESVEVSERSAIELAYLFHHGDEPRLPPLQIGVGGRAVAAVHFVMDGLHRIRVEQVLVGDAPADARGGASHVADLLEQLLRGREEPGPPEHRRVAGEGSVRPLQPRRRRGRVGRGGRERQVLRRDLRGEAVRHVRGVGRRRGGGVGVERRRRRRGRWPRPGMVVVRVRGRVVLVRRVRRREPQLVAPAVLRHVVQLSSDVLRVVVQQELAVAVVLVLGVGAVPARGGRHGERAITGPLPASRLEHRPWRASVREWRGGEYSSMGKRLRTFRAPGLQRSLLPPL
jgi:hypothetical protein